MHSPGPATTPLPPFFHARPGAQKGGGELRQEQHLRHRPSGTTASSGAAASSGLAGELKAAWGAAGRWGGGPSLKLGDRRCGFPVREAGLDGRVARHQEIGWEPEEMKGCMACVLSLSIRSGRVS